MIFSFYLTERKDLAMKILTLVFSLLLFQLSAISLRAVSSSTVCAAENSITTESPNYSLRDKRKLRNLGYDPTDRADDVQWSDDSGSQAVIFDPDGTSEPIRERDRPFNETGATINNSTGDIYITAGEGSGTEVLFGETGQVNILKFNGSTISVP